MRVLCIAVLVSAVARGSSSGLDTSDQGGGADARRVPDAGPDAAPPQVTTAFRFDELRLADPHLYVLAGVACLDVTAIVSSFATQILDKDNSTPPDGLLDGSIAIVFRPLRTGEGARTSIDLEVPSCTAPEETSTCSAGPETPRYATTTTNVTQGACLTVLDGTATYPPILPEPPCFTSEPATIGLNLLGADITLHDARGAATYDGDYLRDGVIRGFLPKKDAEAVLISIPGYPSYALSSFLEGGGSCHDSPTRPMGDLDVGPDGELGWYVYVTFDAVKVPYTER